MGASACPGCIVKLDEDFLKIREYLYKEPDRMNVNDIVENTGVSEKAVLYLIREGRISRAMPKAAGSLKCAVCGTPISSGKLCRRCRDEWSAESGAASAPRGGTRAQIGKSLKKDVKMHTDH
jgi:hypothetical protein